MYILLRTTHSLIRYLWLKFYFNYGRSFGNFKSTVLSKKNKICIGLEISVNPSNCADLDILKK